MGVTENRAAAQAAYDGFVQGEMEALFSQLADDVEWTNHASPEDPLSGTYNGSAGVREYFGKFGEHVELRRFEIDGLVADGDYVVALLDIASLNKATGEEFEGRAVHVLRYDHDGKLTRWELVRAH